MDANESRTAGGTADTAVADLLQMTQKAVEKVKFYGSSSDEFRDKTFRVFIEGGGCSGFQYGFTFDEERDGDTRVRLSDIEVLIDPQSAMYLNGATVDFVEDLRGAGFVVTNPNASGSCGCGHSFSV